MPRQWLTPDDLPTETACWQVLIPVSIECEAAFRGALLLLADQKNWQKHGAVTPEEIAAAFWDGLGTSLSMVPCE